MQKRWAGFAAAVKRSASRWRRLVTFSFRSGQLRAKRHAAPVKLPACACAPGSAHGWQETLPQMLERKLILSSRWCHGALRFAFFRSSQCPLLTVAINRNNGPEARPHTPEFWRLSGWLATGDA